MALAPGLSMGGLTIAGLAGSITVGLIFLTAGAQKLRHRAILSGVIANYRILPDRLAAPLASILPGLEIITGLGLIAGVTLVPVMSALLLLLIFATAMAININRGRTHIDCGCGGPELRQRLSWLLVVRNLVLALLLLPRLASPETPGLADLSTFDLFTVASAGLAAFLAYTLFQTMGSLIASYPVASRR